VEQEGIKQNGNKGKKLERGMSLLPKKKSPPPRKENTKKTNRGQMALKEENPKGGVPPTRGSLLSHQCDRRVTRNGNKDNPLVNLYVVIIPVSLSQGGKGGPKKRGRTARKTNETKF